MTWNPLRIISMNSAIWGSGMAEKIIEAKNLVFGYDPSVPIVKDLSLTVERGEFIAILGTNGAGKTTAVKMLNGLLRPQQGQILIKGRDSREMKTKEISDIVGYCYQNPDHQIFCETVREEVEFGLKNRNVPVQDREKIIDDSLRLVGLLDFKEEAPYMLGKGERQKLAVASILALRPEVLIVDEPTTGLDWRDTRNIFDLLRSLIENGMTCLIITHNLYVVEQYVDRTVLIDNGAIVADGKTQDVLQRTRELNEANVGTLYLTQIVDKLNEKYSLHEKRYLRVEDFAQELIRKGGRTGCG